MYLTPSFSVVPVTEESPRRNYLHASSRKMVKEIESDGTLWRPCVVRSIVPSAIMKLMESGTPQTTKDVSGVNTVCSLTRWQVNSQIEKKTKVTIKRRTYFDDEDPDDNDDDLM